MFTNTFQTLPDIRSGAVMNFTRPNEILQDRKKPVPGAVFWPVAREPCSLTLKTAPGAVFGSLEPLLEPLPTTI